MSRLVLATADLDFEQRIRSAFNGESNGELQRWDDTDVLVGGADDSIERLLGSDSQVLVFGPDVPLDDALLMARRLDRGHSDVSVIISGEATPELLERALHAGVRGILAPKASDRDVRREFQRAAAVAEERRSTRLPPASATGPASKVIAVIAPKGGSGKTLLASNLAVGLAQHHPGEVVLVDLDLQFGDITNALSLTPTHGMGDVAAATGPLDATTLKVFLTQRRDDLFVLCAPDAPAQGEEVVPERVEEAIALLASDFRFVVIDTSAGLMEHTLSALEMSTDLVMVCDLAVASVRGMRKVMTALDQLGMTKQRRHFVLNRADSSVGLNSSEVTATLGRKIDVQVSSARAVPLSMNQGVPIIEAAPRTAVARQLQELTELFAEVPAQHHRLMRRRRA